MKKQNLLLIGALAVGGYFAYKKGLFGGGGSDEETAKGGSDEGNDEGTEESSQIDTVINTSKTGQTVKEAISQAKNLTKNVKDIAVLIKTPKGQSDVVVASGKKKADRKAKRAERKIKKSAKKAGKRDAKLSKKYQRLAQANCATKKGARKRRCETAKKQAQAWLLQRGYK